MKIAEIDRNMRVDNTIDKSGLAFYDIDYEPFRIYGIKRIGEKYRRLPEDMARSVSDAVYALHANTAGGRVRFVSDSKRVAIIAHLGDLCLVPHASVSGTNGFDLYADTKYSGTFSTPYPMNTGWYESVLTVEYEGSHVYTINFPTYCDVYSLAVGVDEGATLCVAPDYKYEKPVVYYGSSITQGGCATRPGMTYQALLSRWLDCNFVNLGFSGSAKGESAMAEYIAGLDMSVFVCDYDHNAPNAEHLERTHYPLYRCVRDAHPDIPIIFMPRPSVTDEGNRMKRLEIIKKTYERALIEGDKNVYFLDASAFFEFNTNEHTVDNGHPTDLGFYFMANGIKNVLMEALEK